MKNSTKKSAKYNAENTKSVQIRINRKTDPEIFEWLKDQENAADSIRNLIKNSIKEDGDLSEINLIDYPWVLVLMNDGTNKEMSLREIFQQAHEISTIAGENPAQDFSVLRILIALVQSIYFHDGADINKWKDILSAGKFDDTYNEYFQKWYDRFFLLGSDRRFLQSSIAQKGSYFKLPKLLSMESGNKVKLFSDTCGIGKKYIDFGRAARQLTFIYFFDDSSLKKVDKTKVSIGSALCGKLSPVWIEGNDLFETLMYNAIQDGKENVPVWEADEQNEERALIELPDNQAAKLTFQSRRLWLSDDGFKVSGFYDLGGNYTEIVDDCYTLHEKDGPVMKFFGEPSMRKYAYYLDTAEIVQWANKMGIVPAAINLAGVFYDSKGSSITDLYFDTIPGFPKENDIKFAHMAMVRAAKFSKAINPYNQKRIQDFESMVNLEFNKACQGMPCDFKKLLNDFIDESLEALPPARKIRAMKDALEYKLK